MFSFSCPLSTADSVYSGGGYGAPYARPAEIVAREVREGLVSRDGALRYGVVLTDALEVEADATATLRAEMVAQKAAKGAEEGAFEINRGGTLAELFERCEEEVRFWCFWRPREPLKLNCDLMQQTGLPPPRLPSGRTLSGPAAGLEHIVALHARRQQEDREEFGDNYERYAGLSREAEVGARGGEGARRCC
jgi:hypothetical protein